MLKEAVGSNGSGKFFADRCVLMALVSLLWEVLARGSSETVAKKETKKGSWCIVWNVM